MIPCPRNVNVQKRRSSNGVSNLNGQNTDSNADDSSASTSSYVPSSSSYVTKQSSTKYVVLRFVFHILSVLEATAAWREESSTVNIILQDHSLSTIGIVHLGPVSDRLRRIPELRRPIRTTKMELNNRLLTTILS